MQTSSSPFTLLSPPSILFNQHASCHRIFYQCVPWIRDDLYRARAGCCDQDLLPRHAAGSLQPSHMRVRQPMKPSHVPPLDPRKRVHIIRSAWRHLLVSVANDEVQLPFILQLWLALWPGTSMSFIVCYRRGLVESQCVRND